MTIRREVKTFRDCSYNFAFIAKLLGVGLDHTHTVLPENVEADPLGFTAYEPTDRDKYARFHPGGLIIKGGAIEIDGGLLDWKAELGLKDMAYEDLVQLAKLGTTIIDGAHIKTGLIDAARIDTGVLMAARIGAGTITADKLILGQGQDNLIIDPYIATDVHLTGEKQSRNGTWSIETSATALDSRGADHGRVMQWEGTGVAMGGNANLVLNGMTFAAVTGNALRCVEGETARLSSQIRKETVAGEVLPTARVAIQWTDIAGVIISYSLGTIITPTVDWQTSTIEGTAPAGTASIVPLLVVTTHAGPTCKIQYDGLELRRRFSGSLEAVTGTFEELTAGTAGAERLEMGKSAGAPFLKMYDSANKLRVSILQDQIEYLDEHAQKGGIIIAEEYVGAAYSRLEVLGDRYMMAGVWDKAYDNRFAGMFTEAAPATTPQVVVGVYNIHAPAPPGSVALSLITFGVDMELATAFGGKIIISGGSLHLPDPDGGAANIQIDFQNNYKLYCDDAGAGADATRLWFDTPDNGEIVFGPRAGANWLHQIRCRAKGYHFEGTGTARFYDDLRYDDGLYQKTTRGIPSGDIQSSAVITAKINNLAVTTDKIAANAVTSAKTTGTSGTFNIGMITSLTFTNGLLTGVT